jgi:hypothetical protein
VAAELARLRDENARLLKMLELSPQQAAPPGPAQAGFFDAPPGTVRKDSPNDAKVAFFRALFAARTDIYATRIENSRTGWKGWLPAVRGGWQRGIPHEKRDYLPLTAGVLATHLKGDAHVGVYPLLDGDKCWWLAADFDGQDALTEALMYVKAGRAFGFRQRWRCRVPGWACTRGFSSPRQCRRRPRGDWAPACYVRRWLFAGR